MSRITNHHARSIPARGGTRCLAFALAVLAVVVPVVSGPRAWATRAVVGSGRYREPVAGGVVIDHFRPPSTPYGTGNRGVDMRVPPDSPVLASAGGVVLFAGAVAGALHVTIAHPDGLRTSYSYLASVAVRSGDRVLPGDPIGSTGVLVHLGVRDRTGAYLDPEALWEGRLRARLVAGPDEGGAPMNGGVVISDELQARRRGSGDRVGVAHRVEVAVVGGSGVLASLQQEVATIVAARSRCTPPATAVPPPPRRRLAILVSGLGSSSASSAIDRLDVGGLGYRPADVVRFSYRGGRVPDGRGGHGRLDALDVTPYSPSDTTRDLHEAARRLLDLITAVRAAEPGVPIDLIAHSQGGVVARLAVGASRAAGPGATVPVDSLITLATPHQGADLATAVTAMGSSPAAARLVDRLSEVTGIAADSPAVVALGQGSDVIAEMARPVPPGMAFLSIGASGDLTVPAVRTAVAGANNVTVHLGGVSAHGELPAQASVTREIGLALSGLAPTCTPLAQTIGDVVVSHSIARAEAALGLAAVALLAP